MKNNKIETFIELCKDKNRIAFSSKKKRISYYTFYQDILKMRAMLEQVIKKNFKVLVLVYPYSYLFYVAMFAGVLSGLQLVIIDSFKEKQMVEEKIKQAEAEYVLLDNKTKCFSFILPKVLKKVILSHYKSFSPIKKDYDVNSTITTFTSGTTGGSKIICRDVNFLMEQIDLIMDNLSLKTEDVVYATLPMYALLVCFLGNEIILCKKLKKVKANVLLTSISSLLKYQKRMPFIQQCFIGGAILYREEAIKIKNLLPYAHITYVYGASEGALIYITSMREYLINPFSFSKSVSSIHCDIVDIDSNGIGEIWIRGNTVISETIDHHTGDLGYIENGRLTIVGRKAYSNKNFYNYIMDDKIRTKNPSCTKAFTFAYQDKYYCIYQGKLTFFEPNITYIKVKKIPMDAKHRTKANYKKVIEDYITKKRVT